MLQWGGWFHWGTGWYCPGLGSWAWLLFLPWTLEVEELVSRCSWRWLSSQNMLGSTCFWRRHQGLIPLRLGQLEFTPLASEMTQWVIAPCYISLAIWVQLWNPTVGKKENPPTSACVPRHVYTYTRIHTSHIPSIRNDDRINKRTIKLTSIAQSCTAEHCSNCSG